MAAGLGLLRLPPAQFWSMTPRELAAALRGLQGIEGRTPPIERSRLEQLMQRHPDAPPAARRSPSPSVAAGSRASESATP